MFGLSVRLVHFRHFFKPLFNLVVLNKDKHLLQWQTRKFFLEASLHQQVLKHVPINEEQFRYLTLLSGSDFCGQ